MLLLVKDLGRVMALNRRRHIILPPSPQRLKQRKGKSREKRGKEEARSFWNRRKRACLIFRSLRGAPLGEDFEPDICGIPQLETFPETPHLFTSKTDKACSRNLCRANCFAREAQEIVWDFCTWGWRNLQLSYRTVSNYKWFVWDSDRCCCKLCFWLNLASPLGL